MKKLLVRKLIVITLFFAVVFVSLPNGAMAETPGETLKNMGYVIGFADGKLHENLIMKQGELVALVSRFIRATQIPKEYQFMAEQNSFDRFVNKVYNFFVKNYYNVRLFFIRTYYELTNKEIYPGVREGHYLFNSIVILKAYGFTIPESIDINAKLTSEDFFNILYGMLGFNENEFENSSDVPLPEKYRIIFSLHGKRNSPLLSKKGYLTRGEVFEEFLRLIQTQSSS
ncbi:hypothetical protein [Caldisericum exile]|uniref:SLH domain-containing protein n=1 Tax=Caldisericum exile (strain DSM 21853 / NBRC 104410 / AZM16c01) TaxID=511051 RepID=A0A7U6GG07_CALEA|nr:hypothetical protein [Caldisericum exile]BAL81641.1 hypothetical protein CSE_15150 [Caldisericum exile AZM16c01]